MKNNYKRIIGVTGPTGAGKSTVCKILKNLGVFIIDTDKISRYVLKYNSECIKLLVEEFSKDILDNHQKIDRKKLANKAFSSKNKTRALNKVTHPFIINHIEKLIKKQNGNNLIVIDAPLLFECGLDKICNFVIAVVAPERIRIQRIIKRDNISLDMAINRISAQNKNIFYEKNADVIIDGILSKESLVCVLSEVVKKYNEFNI